MEQILQILKSVSVLTAFAVIGYLATKTGMLKKEQSGAVGGLLSKLMLPAIIASNVLSPETTTEQIIKHLPMFLAGIAISLLLLGFAFLFSKILKIEDKLKYVMFPLFAAPNSIIIGLPVCESIWGSEGAITCTILAMGADVVTWIVTISILSRASDRINNQTGSAKKNKFHISPVTVAFLIAFVLKFTGVTVPELILKPLSKFGGALSYVGMIYLGMLFVGMNFKPVLKNKVTYIFIPLKCIVLPVIISLIAGLTGIFSAVDVCVLGVVFAASPIISMTPFYKEFGFDYVIGNALTFSCAVLNIITIPIVYFIVNAL